MRIKIYLDEDVPSSFAQALLNRGVDVLQTQQAGNIGKSDKTQLEYAAKNRKTILTHNKKDFIMLHKEYLQCELDHACIIVSDQLPTTVILRRFMKLWFSLSAEDMHNRLEFLSSWR